MKEYRLHIRVSKTQKQELESRAEKAGLSVSDYVRKVSINSNQKFLTDQDRVLFNELRIELRNAANIRNRNENMRAALDPIRGKLKTLIRKFK